MTIYGNEKREKLNKILTKERGITLIALIVTVVITVTVAAVAIINLQQSKMIDYAVKGTEGYTKAQAGEADEMDKLGNKVEGALENIQNGNETNPGGPDTDPDKPEPPKRTNYSRYKWSM